MGDGPRVGSLFSGVGGLDLAVEAWTGGTTAWHCEVEPAAAAVLAARWPGVPNLGDITQVEWTEVAPVDILIGGFPCQDVSAAGLRKGLRPGTRSGLWQYMAAAVDVLRPEMVVIENVRGILHAEAHCDLERDCWCLGDAGEPALRALGAVLGDLSELGYDAAWGTVPASWAGAPHRRERVFVVAADPGRGQLQGSVRGRGLSVAGERGPDRGEEGVAGALTLLPTPTSQAAKHSAPSRIEGGPDRLKDKSNLWVVAALLPTPKTRDHKDGALGVDNKNRADDTDSVPRAVRHLLADPGGSAFGPYTEAVQRWEAVLGRPAPPPAVPNRDGKPRLNPVFVEWMMGFPDGWVTGTGISRTSQLKALGNGVVPQQAMLALDLLVPELLRAAQP